MPLKNSFLAAAAERGPAGLPELLSDRFWHISEVRLVQFVGGKRKLNVNSLRRTLTHCCLSS
jgi:hypothetical protein